MATNTSIFSPRGFLPYVDPGAVVEVTAGSVWGLEDLAPLRRAALVRVVEPPATATGAQDPMSPIPGGGLDPDLRCAPRPGGALDVAQLVARTVTSLSLAGVPVHSTELDDDARALLEPTLLGLLDRFSPALTADPGRREEVSLQVRRHAWTFAGHPRTTQEPPLLVLLPSGELPGTLVADLAAQTWPDVRPVRVAEDDDRAVEALVQALDAGVVYCARLDGDLRYGPYHLADLVQALRYSGADVAHSPARFLPWRGGAWLEQDGLGLEADATAGLAGGSVWYAADGVHPPTTRGYAGHGTGAVPVDATPLLSGSDGLPAAAWRLHPHLPPSLSWLAGSDVGTAGAVLVRPDGTVDGMPPSYLDATSTGPTSRARS